MLSKNQIKSINQLKQKKYRIKQQLFFAEGIKIVKELLASNMTLKMLYATADILAVPEEKYQLISEKELKKISLLKSPQMILGIFQIPEVHIKHGIKLNLALDGVRDPGNLGTIIRLCDWFGIEQLVCSTDTADCYNPKTVQATMGSLARVDVIYTDLRDYLLKSDLPIYGTFMDGKSIYQEHLTKEGIIVMGNEGKGISKSIEELVSYRVAIPQFGKGKSTDSLNVATATAIILNEFMRLN